MSQHTQKECLCFQLRNIMHAKIHFVPSFFQLWTKIFISVVFTNITLGPPALGSCHFMNMNDNNQAPVAPASFEGSGNTWVCVDYY